MSVVPAAFACGDGNVNGPVAAVTGASGFIGSHVCRNLVEHGYQVRACVRDKTQPGKIDHLLAMQQQHSSRRDRTIHGANINGGGNENVLESRGSLTIFEADMKTKGSYDHIFAGCETVFHVAGNFGTDSRWTNDTSVSGRQAPIDQALAGLDPSAKSKNEIHSSTSKPEPKSYDHGVYDSYIVSTKNVLDSILLSKTVRRLVYTSSGAAGSRLTEEEDVNDKDYTVKDNAYGKGKVDAERMIYAFGEEHGIICCSSCPTIVLGPILAAPVHDTVYQHRLGEIFAGKYTLDYNWDVADVRDIADTQRRMAESPKVENGSRYCNCSSFSPENEEVNAGDLASLLRELFPGQAERVLDPPAGDEESTENNSDNGVSSSFSSSDGSQTTESYNSISSASVSDSEEEEQSGYCWKRGRTSTWRDPEKELGLCRHAVTETIKDTIISLQNLGVIDRHISSLELRNYYNVAEMDGCDNEMEYILTELKRRKSAEQNIGSSEAGAKNKLRE